MADGIGVEHQRPRGVDHLYTDRRPRAPINQDGKDDEGKERGPEHQRTRGGDHPRTESTQTAAHVHQSTKRGDDQGCFVHSKEMGSGEGPDKRGGVLNRLFGSRTRLLGRSQSESQATASRNNRILNVRRLRSMTPTHHFPPPPPLPPPDTFCGLAPTT